MKHERGDRASRLDGFEALLRQWNTRINLVAKADLSRLQDRHFADCEQILPLLPPSGAAADLGSGAGLPGLILAIADPAREWHLVESDRRKCAFLTEAARCLALGQVRVHATRIEEVRLPKLEVVTARALAPLRQLLSYAATHLSPTGKAIFLKGKTASSEIAEARLHWRFSLRQMPSVTDSAAVILHISEVARLDG